MVPLIYGPSEPPSSRKKSALGQVFNDAWKTSRISMLRRLPLYNHAEMIERESVRTRKSAIGRWLWAVVGIRNSGACQIPDTKPIATAAASVPVADCSRDWA